MEDSERNHIVINLNKLLDITVCHPLCLAVLIESEVLGRDDLAELESVKNEKDKVLKLYNIVMKKTNSYSSLITAMKESCQSGVVEILNKIQIAHDTESHICNQKESVRFDVWPPVLLFTGRENELSELHLKLQQSESKPTVISQMASVIGLGGIGKTELARRYIETYRSYYDENIIWINAQTQETLSESFQRLASEYLKLSLFNFEGRPKDIGTIVDEVYNFFQDRKSLFVFDNAESSEHLQGFMPFRVTNPPYLLMTSRDKEWEFSVEVLILDGMTEGEATEFVKRGLKVEDENQNHIILQLITRLQCYPLALSQAISFIRQQQMAGNFSVAQYLELYEANTEKLLNSKRPAAEFNPYRETTLTTWKMTTEQIAKDEENGSCAMQILNMISYFQPDKIPFQKFSSLSDDYEDALHLLVKYSMVNTRPNELTLSIHRLVQEVTRIELRGQLKEEGTLNEAFNFLCNNIESDTIYHAVSVFRFSREYEAVIVGFKTISSIILGILNMNRKYNEVITLGGELLEIIQNYVKPEDSAVLRIEYHFAVVEYNGGNYVKSRQSFEELLEKYENVEYSVVSESERNSVAGLLANCLIELGQYEESLVILRENYERKCAVYGVADWRTISTLISVLEAIWQLINRNSRSFLAEEYQTLVKELRVELVAKIAILKDVYDTIRHLFCKDDNWTNVMHSVAQFLFELGDHETSSVIAKEIYEQTKKLEKGSQGRFHLNGTQCLNILANIKRKGGKFDEAKVMYEDVYSNFTELLGSNHLDTLGAKLNVLNALNQQGILNEALDGYNEILVTLESTCPFHSQTYYTQYYIAEILVKLGKVEDGLKSLKQLKENVTEKLGNDNEIIRCATLWIEAIEGRIDSPN